MDLVVDRNVESDAVTDTAVSVDEGPIIRLRHVGRSFQSGYGDSVEILKGANLEVFPGSFNVIRGVSGSGKTTLLRIIGMLDSGFSGSYEFGGNHVEGRPDWYLDELRSANIGFIFQEGRLFGHLSMRRNIELPLILQGDPEVRTEAAEIVDKLAPEFFDDDELNGTARRPQIMLQKPGPTSGGQKQRGSIMRAMINKPFLILADEPTASLNGDLKTKVVSHLKHLSEQGHTVIVVSHDDVFYETGRQFDLVEGVLEEVTEPDQQIDPTTSAGEANGYESPAKQTIGVKLPELGSELLWGWKPRAPVGVLIRQAIRETIFRPIFFGLILVSLAVGVCQIAVFSSVILGAEEYLDQAITEGSRLNRVEVKPRFSDRKEQDRFPIRAEIGSWGETTFQPRRTTMAAVQTVRGERSTYQAMGLHANDPEYKLLNFVAGGPFSGDHDQLEVIITAGLLGDLFDISDLETGKASYDDFIGRKIAILLNQFTKAGKVKGNPTPVSLKLTGVVLHAEGSRQMYLPNTTHLVFDRFKMDRHDEFVLPVSADVEGWTDLDTVKAMASFPWEDSLQVYTDEMRGVIPLIRKLSELGYKPESDIWDYKWALDVQDTAWRIFIPLLGLIILAVAITVAANIFTSAKLRETELALWRILGMRRGDLVLTQIIATAFSVLVGCGIGLLLGNVLVEQSKELLAERGAEAAVQSGGDAQDFEAIFAPVDEFYLPILGAALVIGVCAALYPAFRAARTDPAKVLQA